MNISRMMVASVRAARAHSECFVSDLCRMKETVACGRRFISEQTDFALVKPIAIRDVKYNCSSITHDKNFGREGVQRRRFFSLEKMAQQRS